MTLYNLFHFPNESVMQHRQYLDELQFVEREENPLRRHLSARCPSRNQPLYQWPKNRGDQKFICGGTECKVSKVSFHNQDADKYVTK